MHFEVLINISNSQNNPFLMKFPNLSKIFCLLPSQTRVGDYAAQKQAELIFAIWIHITLLKITKIMKQQTVLCHPSWSSHIADSLYNQSRLQEKRTKEKTIIGNIIISLPRWKEKIFIIIFNPFNKCLVCGIFFFFSLISQENKRCLSGGIQINQSVKKEPVSFVRQRRLRGW